MQVYTFRAEFCMSETADELIEYLSQERRDYTIGLEKASAYCKVLHHLYCPRSFNPEFPAGKPERIMRLAVQQHNRSLDVADAPRAVRVVELENLIKHIGKRQPTKDERDELVRALREITSRGSGRPASS